MLSHLFLALVLFGSPAQRLAPYPAPFDTPIIAASETEPREFELVLTRELPSPAWTLTLDALEVDKEKRRIIAEVTEQSSGGMAAQVIVKRELRLSLGSIEAGFYVVELRLRRGTKKPHVPVQSLVLRAS